MTYVAWVECFVFIFKWGQFVFKSVRKKWNFINTKHTLCVKDRVAFIVKNIDMINFCMFYSELSSSHVEIYLEKK